MFPVILLVGHAKSGKDTVADMLREVAGAQPIALADPFKRLAQDMFGLTYDQLWGPSESRNANAPQFADMETWKHAQDMFYPGNHGGVTPWLQDVFGVNHARTALYNWFNSLSQLDHKAITPRYVLQTLGSEFGRAVNRDCWVDYALKTAETLIDGGFLYLREKGIEPSTDKVPLVVITDGRFRNEILAVKRLGGQVWRIDREGVDGSEAMKAGIQGHASEMEQKTIPDHWFDVIIKNDGTLDDLKALVESMISCGEEYSARAYGGSWVNSKAFYSGKKNA